MPKLYVKGKPRGNPEAVAAYRWKKGQSGNPLGRSHAKRVSDALIKQLAAKNDEANTRADAIASNLLDRAEKNSEEVEFVINITEPGLLAPQNAGAAAFAKVAIVDTFGDGTAVISQAVSRVASGRNGSSGELTQGAAGADGVSNNGANGDGKA